MKQKSIKPRRVAKDRSLIITDASTHEGPVLSVGLERIQFRDLMGKNKKQGKVWYVVYTRTVTIKDHELGVKYDWINEWDWAHTKSWARELARRYRDQGHHIVDIFQGTKSHINHKFQGLK